MSTKQNQEREQGIQLPVSHTIFAVAWAPCQEWKLFFIKHELHVNG